MKRLFLFAVIGCTLAMLGNAGAKHFPKNSVLVPSVQIIRPHAVPKPVVPVAVHPPLVRPIFIHPLALVPLAGTSVGGVGYHPLRLTALGGLPGRNARTTMAINGTGMTRKH